MTTRTNHEQQAIENTALEKKPPAQQRSAGSVDSDTEDGWMRKDRTEGRLAFANVSKLGMRLDMI
jgi:hypothetical protein